MQWLRLKSMENKGFTPIKSGFTLVELLVAIAIVAILATISVTVFATVQKNNRDQKRLRDLNTIKQALELYRNDQSSYPDTGKVVSLLVPRYLDIWLQDPVTGNSYTYFASSQTTFVVCAIKEGNNSYSLPDLCKTVNCGTGIGNCGMGLSAD